MAVLAAAKGPGEPGVLDLIVIEMSVSVYSIHNLAVVLLLLVAHVQIFSIGRI